MPEMITAQIGSFVVLRVADLNRVGAFLDSGDRKDLFLPFAEQTRTLRVGQNVLVYTYVDNTERVCASMRFERNIDTSAPPFNHGQPVSIVIAAHTDLGYKAIVAGRYLGLIYANEVYQPLAYAQEINGWIKQVRADGKIDLQLTDPKAIGHTSADPIANQILSQLSASETGFLPINDKSPAEEIYERFGVSRKKFKIALGGLYKRRKISVDDDGIRIIKSEDGTAPQVSNRPRDGKR